MSGQAVLAKSALQLLVEVEVAAPDHSQLQQLVQRQSDELVFQLLVTLLSLKDSSSSELLEALREELRRRLAGVSGEREAPLLLGLVHWLEEQDGAYDAVLCELVETGLQAYVAAEEQECWVALPLVKRALY